MLVSHGSNFLKGLPRIFVLCMISFPIKTEFHFADPVQPCIVLSSSVLTSGLECATAEMGGRNQRVPLVYSQLKASPAYRQMKILCK